MRTLLRTHPLLSFFTLALGLSWLAWTPFVLSRDGLGVLPFAFSRLLGTPQLLGMLPGAYLGPLTAAFTVTLAAEGRAGLRHWAARLPRWKVRWRWYLVVLLGVPASIVAATLLLPDAWGNVHAPSLTILLAYLPLLVLQLVTTAAAEESGWRNFALPRLQQHLGPVPGTVVLGEVWGRGHVPPFLTEWGGYPDVSWVAPVEFVTGCVPLSIVMPWVFNRTR